MRARFIVAILVSLTMSFSSAPGFAAVKAGATCPKLNTTTIVSGYKYKCVKSGKKLVWGKGVKVVAPKVISKPTAETSSAPTAPSASPVPSSFATPTPSSTSSSASPTQSPAPSQSSSPSPSQSASPSPSASNAIVLDVDGYPPNVPAPGRSCPNVDGTAQIYGAKMTCLKDAKAKDGGKWTLNAGEVITKPTGNESVSTPGATTSSTPSASASSNSENAAATPSPSATPSQISGSSSVSATVKANRDLTRLSIQTALIAIKDIQDILASAPQSKNGFEIFASPNVDAKLVQLARDTLPTATKFFSNVYDPIKPAAVIYSYWTDIEWAVAADKAAGDTPNGSQSLGEWMAAKPASAYFGELGSGSHSGVTVNGFTPKIILVTSGPDAANRPGGTTTANHEYVHNVQQELSPTKFLSSPCWFVEGMAQYYGMVLAYPDAAKYLDNRELVLKDREFGAYPFDSQRSIAAWQASLVANEAPSCGAQGGYWIGPLAVEKLVSMKGTVGVLALTKEIERVGNFTTAFKNIYGIDVASFYALAADHIEDSVGDLLGISATKSDSESSSSGSTSSSSSGSSTTKDPVVTTQTTGTSNNAAIIAAVKRTMADSKAVPTSPLIHILIEPGAMTAEQEKWLTDSLQFISYISPPTSGGDWNLVFPRTMEWFLQNWDISKEQQRYKDMFANNTAEQLVGSVHSYGTNNGGWAASFFVSPTKNWFNPDWQMRFMAQLLKPTGFASNIAGTNYPEWFTRMFAYPIGAAYSQLTSTGDYAAMRSDWLTLLNTLPKPINLADYVSSAAYTGPENNKMPGALADEILIAKVGIAKATNFLVEIAASGKSWDQQLQITFGISKEDLYAQVAAISK